MTDAPAAELVEGLRDGTIAEGLATIYGHYQDYSRASSFAREALDTNDLSAEEQRKVLQILLEGHVFAHRVEDVIVHQGVLEEGVNLIEKPFAADNLLRRVREVLDSDG